MSSNVEKTCLIVPNYGAAFEGMLMACLESVARQAPETLVYVAWQDMADDRVDALKRAYPNTRWIKSDFAISSDYVVRISAKTLLATVAAKVAIADGFGRLILMDSDILMRACADEAFAEDFDIGFTDKPERWPLNSGVVFMKSGRAEEFLHLWSAENSKICSSPTLLKEASSKERPYGGIDQMALYLMVAYEHGRESLIERGGIRYRALPCSVYNETRSLQLSCPAKLIHYKGGWHRILTKGAWYSSKRPMAASLEMHQFYLRTALDGLKRVNETAGRDWTLREWNLALPEYLDGISLNPIVTRVMKERMLSPLRYAVSGARHIVRRYLA